MDFASLVLGLITYYIRPQEWLPAIQPLRPVTIIMAIAVASVIMKPGAMSREQMFKTPLDWLLLLYALWAIIATPDHFAAFKFIYPYYLFFLVTLHAMENIERMRRFLLVWTFMIFLLTVLGVLSINGFDPTGGYDITYGSMKGRLVLGTSIFNNPNALGHSIAPMLMMLYFLFIWKRPVFSRVFGMALLIIPCYCLYLTLSKGAFVSGFATVLTSMIFGRHKVAQVLILVFGLTAGWAWTKTLPRMQELQSSKTDEAIQGRVTAFKFGLGTLKGSFTGIGLLNFQHACQKATNVWKAPHSSYNEVGAELGKIGFVLFLSILYTGLRVLWTSKTRNVDEERLRRLLFTMLIGYMISSWMVDFAFRVSFFMLLGVIAAYHRLMLQTEGKSVDNRTAQEVLGGRLAPASAALQKMPSMSLSMPANPSDIGRADFHATMSAHPLGGNKDGESDMSRPGITWVKFGFLDIAGVIALYWISIQIWELAIRRM